MTLFDRRYSNIRYIKPPYNKVLASSINKIIIRLYVLFLDILLLVNSR